MSANISHFRKLSSTASSAISISRAKSRLRSEYDPDKALEIYSSISKDYVSPVSSRYAQYLTVQRLFKSHRFSDIENLLESQKNDPKITQEPYLSTLIGSYVCANMIDRAMRTYDQMDQLGTPRSAISFNALLSACNQSKLFDKVPQLFDEIPKKYNVVPDKISYGILVKSYCEVDQPEKALEIVKEMEEKGAEVTAVTYTTILNALYRKGKSDEAENLWYLMDKKGCVDVTAYNVRLMYVQRCVPEDMKAAIDEMSNAGVKPDTVSYNILMTCYLKCGMVKEGKEVYKGLKKNGCNPNAATFRTLINSLCKHDHFEEGYKIFKESVKVHKIPGFSTMELLVEGLLKKGKKKEAKGLIRTIKKRFPPSMLESWGKIDENLSLTSVVPESKEADSLTSVVPESKEAEEVEDAAS